MKNRSRDYYRDLTWRKALRKRRIAREILQFDYYSNLHQYSKNKIHCSCPLCQTRTKVGRKQLDWSKGRYNWKISEQRKIDSKNYQEEFDF